MTDVCIKSDYAVLNTKDYGFYYGYEFDSKECECGESIDIWGFEVTKDNNSIYRIKAEEMLDDMVNAVKQEHKRKRRGE